MIVKGKYNQAKVFTDKLDQGSKSQIEELLDQDFLKDSKVRIMPDVHQGMGCVIGFTADMGDKVIPNIVGVDIGCGMLTIKLGELDIDLERLDKIIHREIPGGFRVHKERKLRYERLKDLHIYRELEDTRRIERSIGSLGGGNHFIEVGEDSKGIKYMVIHSGSRNLGKQVADYYQKLAIDLASGNEDFYRRKEELIEDYKKKGQEGKIEKALKKLRKEYRGNKPEYPKALCYLEGSYRQAYLDDMKICQEYASLNRSYMADIILRELFDKGLDDFPHFETIHNYIDFRDNVIRKGAVAAHRGELLLIPINMRDGSILARGKGNEDWNRSAPHGAGRLFSRTESKKIHSLEDFKKDMEGIYTTSISKSTLDENPQAYKPMEEILDNIGDSVEVIDIIKPIYNFKA